MLISNKHKFRQRKIKQRPFTTICVANNYSSDVISIYTLYQEHINIYIYVISIYTLYKEHINIYIY